MSKLCIYGRETLFGFKLSAVSFQPRYNQADSLGLIADSYRNSVSKKY